ncbi:glycoside hydrolase family 13 protein [Paenibacillus turpanensis]|uniref:glycoside hydrolase family 13 protein n=1 Tax=Paenibacillus turpanensis TaxID=2689078 RepID=UPI00140C6ED3|nr:alpha-glucosidase [Paenibacillus turpanensis]
MNKKWWKESVVYQIYPRSFVDSNGDGVGDIRGILSKLDYLKDLGVDVIWICPIYESPNDDNGYDISNYQDIMKEFGTMDDFDELLEQAHARGIKIIMDLVVNHTSDEHPWFIESRSSKDNPKRDWYIWRPGKNGKEPNNWESIFGGSAWQLDQSTGEYYMHLFSVRQPDLNWENAKVRTAVYDMIRWWLDKGIDGFRVDAITHIKKIPGMPDLPNPEGKRYVPSWEGHMNRPGIHEFLQELKKETFARYDIMTVGEANGVTMDQAEDYVGEGRGVFNMIFQFNHMNIDAGPDGKYDVRGKFDLDELKKILTEWQKGLEGRGWNALYLENHDVPRSVSRFADDKEFWLESAKMLATLYFLMQGTPYIYQGQEIGMTNVRFPSIDDYNDVEAKGVYREGMLDGKPVDVIMEGIYQRGRDNARTPMQWNTSANAGFTSGKPWLAINPNYTKINVEAQLEDPNSIYNYYKSLIRLRAAHEAAVYGTYDLVGEEHKSVYAYTRTLGDEKLLIVCSFSKLAATFRLPEPFKAEATTLLLSNYSETAGQPESATLTLRPFEARVYKAI